MHCIEGGFHLGPDPDAVAGEIAHLADRGVFYITLAHLIFRGVAANAPALPMFSDEQYNAIFDQPDEGLSSSAAPPSARCVTTASLSTSATCGRT